MRFVGGQISHATGVTVDTPVATLGIRGGVATVVFPVTLDFAPGDPNLAGSSGELVIGHVGILTLKNKVSQVTIRPGFATWVSGPDVPILPPFRISDLALARIVASLTSGPGQAGGAGHTGSPEAFIIRDGIGTVILDNPARPPAPTRSALPRSSAAAMTLPAANRNPTRSRVPRRRLTGRIRRRTIAGAPALGRKTRKVTPSLRAAAKQSSRLGAALTGLPCRQRSSQRRMSGVGAEAPLQVKNPPEFSGGFCVSA